MFEQRKNILLLPSELQDEAHKYIGIKSNWTKGHPCDLLLQRMTHDFLSEQFCFEGQDTILGLN